MKDQLAKEQWYEIWHMCSILSLFSISVTFLGFLLYGRFDILAHKKILQPQKVKCYKSIACSQCEALKLVMNKCLLPFSL